MKLIRVPDNSELIPSRKSDKHYIQLATNRDILASVIETCKQFHRDCETCPYWLKNKYNCIWNAHKIIGKDVMAYWDDEVEIDSRDPFFGFLIKEKVMYDQK